MPILKRIKSFFKAIFKQERIIDPSKHHKSHEIYYKISRDLQKEFDFDKKTAMKYTTKILKLPRGEISDIDRQIIEAHSP